MLQWYSEVERRQTGRAAGTHRGTTMPRTAVHLTINEPRPGHYLPDRVSLVCPRCRQRFQVQAAAVSHGTWTFPCPACRSPLTLNALAGRSLRGPEQWVYLKSLVAL